MLQRVWVWVQLLWQLWHAAVVVMWNVEAVLHAGKHTPTVALSPVNPFIDGMVLGTILRDR